MNVSLRPPHSCDERPLHVALQWPSCTSLSSIGTEWRHRHSSDALEAEGALIHDGRGNPQEADQVAPDAESVPVGRGAKRARLTTDAHTDDGLAARRVHVAPRDGEHVQPPGNKSLGRHGGRRPARSGRRRGVQVFGEGGREKRERPLDHEASGARVSVHEDLAPGAGGEQAAGLGCARRMQEVHLSLGGEHDRTLLAFSRARGQVDRDALHVVPDRGICRHRLGQLGARRGGLEVVRCDPAGRLADSAGGE
eukprot:1216380-Prymnesium_polylepis.3